MPAHESRFHSSKADKKVKLPPFFYSVASILKLAKNRWNLEYNLFPALSFLTLETLQTWTERSLILSTCSLEPMGGPCFSIPP